MSVSRVLIRHDGSTYRFLKLETRPDGSLLIIQDRDKSTVRQPMSFEDGSFVPAVSTDKSSTHARISCHTTGEIHYYNAGVRRQTFHIEPLFALSRGHIVGFFSIPRPSRLDLYDEAKHAHDLAAVIDLPSTAIERMTFVVELSNAAPRALDTYGVALSYELYVAIIRLIPRLPFDVRDDMIDHFIQGAPTKGAFNSRQIDKATAELSFHQRIHGEDAIIFREQSGAYLLLTTVPMRVAPKLKIKFARDDLTCEAATSTEHPSTHKVRFWIRDSGGRNKTEDLRRYIQEIELSAEI